MAGSTIWWRERGARECSLSEIVYNGRRLRAQAHALPGGGFAAKIIVWPLGSTGGSSRIGMLPARWATRQEAEEQGIALGQRIVDAEQA